MSVAAAKRTVASILVATMLASISLASGSVTAAEGPGPAAFVPVQPCRLLDTRIGPGTTIPAAGTLDVQVIDRCGVGDSAVAAALTVTVVRPESNGFLTLFPLGAAQPDTSSITYGRSQVVANSMLSQLGDQGSVSLFTLAGTHVVVDVSGYFVEAPAEGSAAGRFESVPIHRLIDTRLTGRPAPEGSIRVTPEVPPDAIAVAVNITTTSTTGPDFLTAFPAGSDLPIASVLNVDRGHQTRAAFTIVPISDSGFDVFTHNGNHVIVDIAGYFTGPSAPTSTDGLFVAAPPSRLVDTRLAVGSSGGPRLWDGGGREFAITTVTDGPVAAIAANVTVAQTEDAGFVAAHPARIDANGTSTVNYDSPARVAANMAIISVSQYGVGVDASEATHLIIDVTGWFTGSAMTATGAAPANHPPGDRRVTIISDSAMAGIRWNGALGGLQGFIPVAKLESCRRLVRASCRGRDGYRPATAEHEIGALPVAGREDILVIAVGYNDWHTHFSSDFDIVVGAARARGFHHIVWVNYMSRVGYTLPGTGERSNYGEMNAVLIDKVGSGEFPDVRIWDLDLYSTWSPGWFASDGVHETQLGSWGVADWISRHVRAFDDRPCVQPWVPGALVDDPCPNPDGLPESIGLPDIAGLYGLSPLDGL